MRFTLPNVLDNDTKAGTSENRCKKNFHIEGTFAVPRPVPYGYEYFCGIGYYKFYPLGSKSFNSAIAICENDGAYLAILNSEAEMEVLRSIFARHPYLPRYAYLGFHDQKKEGDFVTIFGDPLSETGYERWLDEEPNQSNDNEDCGTMHRSGHLNDYPCERSFEVPFFCEYDPFLLKSYEKNF
ncbi:hypothetical protein J437_LFUL016949 [Ladona fulva]|uniref:C-type lectin domain-containing protein n=1 Tax=Ladona fulva TaxID=123851 RepID=A0A8K0KK92_LADFU|nr:hypothetical protein J437_LFUL016949 [Ladona fulva]